MVTPDELRVPPEQGPPPPPRTPNTRISMKNTTMVRHNVACGWSLVVLHYICFRAEGGVSG